jgi:hypothetical protein
VRPGREVRLPRNTAISHRSSRATRSFSIEPTKFVSKPHGMAICIACGFYTKRRITGPDRIDVIVLVIVPSATPRPKMVTWSAYSMLTPVDIQ